MVVESFSDRLVGCRKDPTVLQRLFVVRLQVCALGRLSCDSHENGVFIIKYTALLDNFLNIEAF
jgi:hypothetical protein